MRKNTLRYRIKDLLQKFPTFLIPIIIAILVPLSVGSFTNEVFAANEIEILGFKDITENTGTVRYKINTSTVTSYAVVYAISASPQLTEATCDVLFTGNYIPETTYFRTFSNLSPDSDVYVQVCVIDNEGKFYVTSGNEKFTTLGGEGGEGGNPIIVGDDGGTSSGQSIKLDNPLKNGNIQSIPDLVKAILEIALKIGVPLIALAIIYAGFKFITAQGNPTKLDEAKQTLIYVVVGAAILLAAYAIATAIVNTVGSVTG